MTHGLYRVVGKREYRGHEPGEEFEARLERNAEKRAVMRGDLQILGYVLPELPRGSYEFPQGWLDGPEPSDHRDAERRLSRKRRR